MSQSAEWLRVNVPTIAAEEIDGEVVVVSFETGHYYSLRDTAADTWRLLDSGLPIQSVIDDWGADAPTVAPVVAASSASAIVA